MSPMFVDSQPGEILKFKDVFGIEFGTAGKKFKYFGSSGMLTSNPTDICLEFETPDHVEKAVGFSSFALLMMAGPRDLIVADHPYPEKTDEGVVGYVSYPGAGGLGMFVSADGKDPATVSELDPSTGRLVQRPGRRTTALDASSKYYVRLVRTKVRLDGRHPPLKLEYFGSDDPAGEAPIKVAPSVTVTPIDVSDNPTGIPMTFGDLSGIFIPDK